MKPQYRPISLGDTLGYLIEEAGEVLAAAGKSMRWGFLSVNPELPEEQQEFNAVWLRREMADLRRALDMMEARLDQAEEIGNYDIGTEP
jgi:hypothetical protein